MSAVRSASPPPSPGERPGLLFRVRGQLSLTKMQAIFGLVAALLSIGGAFAQRGRGASPVEGGRLPSAGDSSALHDRGAPDPGDGRRDRRGPHAPRPSRGGDKAVNDVL